MLMGKGIIVFYSCKNCIKIIKIVFRWMVK